MGFRPFFLFAAIWAALSVLLWIGFWSGAPWLNPPIAALDWHIHEMLFGYGGAVLCGFLLTAVPNWTGRRPLSGAPLGGLVGLWLVARVALLTDLGMPAGVLMALDLAFPTLFCLFTARELIAAKNRRNLPVLAICVAFLLANGAFHLEIMREGSAMHGPAMRAGIGVLILLIALIGGRIIPAFTRNWLTARGVDALPMPFGRFDMGVLALTGLGLAAWCAWPTQPATGAVLLLTGGLHVLRLSRWRGLATRSEPLMLSLHLAYGFLPLGFLLMGLSILKPVLVPESAAIHAWTAGAVGLMTLTVMSRATLGHSGRALRAGWAETLFLNAILAAALLRVLAAFPIMPNGVLHLSATLWIGGFAVFALRFLPVMLTPRPIQGG